MSELVLIKGNQHGLNIILDKRANLKNIKSIFQKKLEDGRKFFGNSKVSINFEGRELNSIEQKAMIDIIHKSTDMEVFCVIDHTIPIVKQEDYIVADTVAEALIDKSVLEPYIPKEAAIFYQGTLRSGQELNVDSGIVILGDINPGAKVISKGNIIIIGSLKGYVHAGSDGSRNACVVALNMQPTQIRIDQIIARSPDKFSKKKTEPQIAFLEDKRIIIDYIHKNLYKHIKLLN